MSVRRFALLAVAGAVFLGCSSKQPLPLAEAASNSYQITNGMDQSAVRAVLPMKPTSVQRINNEEIWKYEGSVCDSKTEENMYHNIIVKFVDGKVKHVGTFSCKLPSLAGK